MKAKPIILLVIVLVVICIGYFIIGKGYDNKISTSTSVSDYDNFLVTIDQKCPFISTAVTGECLDREINKQNNYYNLLSNKIHKIATSSTRSEEISSQVLSKILPEYNKDLEDHINNLCSLKNFDIEGSGIVEESRKCYLYYIKEDINLLRSILFRLEGH